jgi:hypothetical protein
VKFAKGEEDSNKICVVYNTVSRYLVRTVLPHQHETVVGLSSRLEFALIAFEHVKAPTRYRESDRYCGRWRDVSRGTGLFGLEGLEDLDRGGDMVWITTVAWKCCVSWYLIVWCYEVEESQSIDPLDSVQQRRTHAILNPNAKRHVTLERSTVYIDTSVPGSEYRHVLVMLTNEYTTGLPRAFRTCCL